VKRRGNAVNVKEKECCEYKGEAIQYMKRIKNDVCE
jgi:hypothetical protein